MEKTVKIRLFSSVAGTNYAFGKGEIDVPEHIARELVKAGHAEYVGQKPSDRAENALSPKAQKREKR